MVIRPTSHVVVEPAKGGRSCWLEDVRVPGTPHDRRIVAGVDVDQLTRLPVERDEGCGGKPVAWGVPDQMPVDLRRQRRHVRCYRRQAPHQRLNLAPAPEFGGQQRGRHALAGMQCQNGDDRIATIAWPTEND
jgi:hypothetical protein